MEQAAQGVPEKSIQGYVSLQGLSEAMILMCLPTGFTIKELQDLESFAPTCPDLKVNQLDGVPINPTFHTTRWDAESPKNYPPYASWERMEWILEGQSPRLSQS